MTWMTWTSLDQRGQRLGDRGVEAADGLRAAEDEEQSAHRPGRRSGGGPPPGRSTRRSRIGVPGHGSTAPRSGNGAAGRREAHGEDVGEAGRRPDAPARDDVALPEDDRDAERCGRHEDRDGDVAAGREDRRRAIAGEDRRRLGHRRPEADRVEDEVGVALDRSERAQDEAAERDAGRPDDRPSRPRWPPSQRSSGIVAGRVLTGVGARSDRATARAG